MMKPNILFLMNDQQRYDCIGAAGKYPVKTPNLDALAADGVFFEQAYTTNPVCVPAREALFTGRRPEAHGGLFNPGSCFPIGAIPEDMPRWTTHFAEAGYETSYIGQWVPDPKHPPADYGYGHYIPHSVFMKKSREGGVPDYEHGWFGDPAGIPLERAVTHLCAEAACGEIDRMQATGRPWYLHIDSTEPHLPCRPSAPFDTMYDPDEIPKWEGFDETFEDKPYIQRQQPVNWGIENLTWDDWKRTAALYYGVVSQYDDAVGRILSHLKEIGQYENTIIIYTADHGDMCGSHHMIDKHYIMYEDVCHIPLIIAHPGTIVPRRVKHYTQHMIDLPPTMLELAGISDPPEKAQFHGRSLAGLLGGAQVADTGFAVSCYNGQQFGLYCQRSIKTDDYKYVLNSTDTDELYYLPDDPGELHNVIREKEHSAALPMLRRKLYDELVRCGDPLMKWCSAQLTEGRKL